MNLVSPWGSAYAVLTREHVACGNEPEQPLLRADDEETCDCQAIRLGSSLRDCQPRLDDIRLRNDMGEIALHPPHLSRLLLDREEAVNDADAPPDRLTFSLGPNAPAGARTHPATGVFRWWPSRGSCPPGVRA